ncbi:E3 ubiquitin-protein ligase SINA-like 4 [Hordeum vulgare subsp. vulgare]|uniref:SIAH-type domain-containing protein n=1 Tax=Hordeum vulgare subsp. vulgare TaxID=112509 RepID=A0A8I6Y757_HORVV|nr:E3 ubiquitin-protein ligase SINA-like 4 [Hordeum vulgare subsp. vulgare]
MGGKRKSTGDVKTPSTVGRRPGRPRKNTPPEAIRRPGRPRKSVPGVEVPVARGPASAQTLAPSRSEHEEDGNGGLLELARGAAAIAAAEEEEEQVKLRCDLCHGPLRPPIYQCTRVQHVACGDCGAGECRPCGGDPAAVFVHNAQLDALFGYIKVPCAFRKFGCASSVAYRDMASHEAACAWAPCACAECGYKGPPSGLLHHLTELSGRHAWTAHRITYGMDHQFAVPVPELSDQQCEDRGLLVAEDGALFLVAVGGVSDVRRVTVVCVRGNVGTGPVYSSSVEVAGPDEARRLKLENKVAASCSAPVEFDVLAQPECDTVPVYPEMLHGEELHLCIRIGKTKIICS